ncbi:MAG: AmmeMemoRadiSam system protein B [Anaerolineae bacterium]|nr:AmmeMemoRadiSam system protein B [Anaerolineae bacterium]MDW8069317.1 AmmeMemoRadiSam system protein B [Anaerolineae bacterium]
MNRITFLPGVLVCLLLLASCANPSPTAETPRSASPTPIVPSGYLRRPAIAGSWYPADPDELAQMIDGMLEAERPVDGAPLVLLVPHAGYVYSGPVAAAGFRQLRHGEYDVAVLIASDHQAPLSRPVSVWAEGAWETPLGIVPVDADLAWALIRADSRITFDPEAHQGEHPIEIELPFLQRVCPHCRIVPILMGTDDEETVRLLADALLSALPGRKAVVIASSDLSHYPSREDALVVDGAILAAIETGDPDRLRETIAATMRRGVPGLVTCACGEGPIRVAMRVAAGLGADTVSVLRYANSADSPYGDPRQVVGYGAVMFWRYVPPDLTPARQEALLALARRTLESYLIDGTLPAYETDDPHLLRLSGVFVTLREDGELRGCLGHLRADTLLYRAVQEMAVAAATQDPRFPPLTREELERVRLEISVLSPFRRLTDPTQIEIGTHGLLILKDGQQGLLLPQVAVEEGWDRETFLEELCRKAGLPAGCWREDAALYTFTAVVFGE